MDEEARDALEKLAEELEEQARALKEQSNPPAPRPPLQLDLPNSLPTASADTPTLSTAATS